MRPGTIPAEPIRRAVERWIDEREKTFVFAHGEPQPGGEFAGNQFVKTTAPLSSKQECLFRIWGEGATDDSSTPYRCLNRLLDRREGGRIRNGANRENPYLESFTQKTINFDLADKILCALNLVHLWQEDPELHEIYLSFDLAALDAIKPCIDKTVAA